MTFAEVAAIMLGGGSSGGPELPMPDYIQYYDYQSSVQDYEYNNGSWTYSPSRIVPANSITIRYYIRYENGNVKYKFNIFQLIIEELNTQNEEVVGIIDLQTDTEYHFQFNVRGGR